MALTLTTKTIKFGDGTTGTGQFATDGTNFWPVHVIVDNTGAIVNPLSTATVNANGAAAASASAPVALSNEDAARVGIITETAPASDTASSGMNGRLQRVAQRITSLITALGSPFQAGGSIGNTSFGAVASGDTASGASDAGNPVKIGARAVSAEPTALTTGQRANLISDLVGKQIVLPYANPENFVSGAITAAMTSTTTTSLVAAPAAGLRNYITTIIVSNSHATVGTDIIIQDGSGGTTLLTIPAAAVYGGATITLPVPLRQPTTATALFCANVTTGASTKVSAIGYKGA